MDEENKETKKQDMEQEDKKNENVENQKEVKKEEQPTNEQKETKDEKKEVKKEEQAKDKQKDVKKDEKPKEQKKEAKKEELTKNTKKATTKTFEKSKTENKKTNNIIIPIVAVIAIVIIAIFGYIFMTADSPKNVVNSVFKDLKEGNTSQSVLASAFEQENFDEETKKLLFDKLEWKILEVKEDKDTATVKVEVTNKDFKTAINKYMQKAIKAAFSSSSSSEEDATNYLIEELNSSELQTVTSEQIIDLKKQDGKWQVSEENDFVNILLPGFGEALSAFN